MQSPRIAPGFFFIHGRSCWNHPILTRIIFPPAYSPTALVSYCWYQNSLTAWFVQKTHWNTDHPQANGNSWLHLQQASSAGRVRRRIKAWFAKLPGNSTGQFGAHKDTPCLERKRLQRICRRFNSHLLKIESSFHSVQIQNKWSCEVSAILVSSSTSAQGANQGAACHKKCVCFLVGLGKIRWSVGILGFWSPFAFEEWIVWCTFATFGKIR